MLGEPVAIAQGKGGYLAKRHPLIGLGTEMQSHFEPSLRLPYTPLPTAYRQLFHSRLTERGFDPHSIRDDHEFTAPDGRLRLNCVAFGHVLHFDPDTSAFAVYYDPMSQIETQHILEGASFSAAPFVLIARREKIYPFGMGANGRPIPAPIGEALSYSDLGNFLEAHKADINPSRIMAVKQGLARFATFPNVDPFQLRLFTIDITSRLLAENFAKAVNVLRQDADLAEMENLATEIAVQLLGAIILAHKGRLGDKYSHQQVALNEVFARACKLFPGYFDVSLTKKHNREAEAAYSVLQRETYSSFTPDMLSELYKRAFPDAEKRKREGRFDTPLYLTRKILDNLPIESIRPEERLILDMTCGWGSFLVAGYERLSRLTDMADSRSPLWKHIIGNDIDAFTAQLAKLALLTTALSDSWNVMKGDALALEMGQDSPTVIVGNPKFSANRKLGEEAIELDGETGRRKRLQEADRFLNKAIQLLKPGGFLGMLMPQSFLVAEASTRSRKLLLESCDILEIWDLPLSTFQGNAKVSPMVLFAQKREDTGFLLDKPVRVRVAQGQTLRDSGVFAATSLALSQGRWGSQSTKVRDRVSRNSVAYMIRYTTILSEISWSRITEGCVKASDMADITQGAIVGTQRRWQDFPKPKKVKWLSGAKDSIPRSFYIRYEDSTILYPNDLEEPRKSSRYPEHDKECLLAGPKVLLVSIANPSWGKRNKVAIERKGYYPSDSFWVFVPKVPSTSLEVLAALLDWYVSNAWIVENLREPKISRRTIDSIPIPILGQEDCILVTKAVYEIERRAAAGQAAPNAEKIIDGVLKRAYGLDDQTFDTLRRIAKWNVDPPNLGRPDPPKPESVLRVGGQVEAVDSRQGALMLWFDGIPGVHFVPITDIMPGWMLRAGAAFRADVSFDALRNEAWEELIWWNITPQEYTYLSEGELLERLSVEIGR